jgi:subtilisin-like proprotein convertase family protein
MGKICFLIVIAFSSLSAGTININFSTSSFRGFSTLTDVTVSSGTINLSIPDENALGTSNTLNVSGIPVGATIDSVIATFTITHTFLSDIVVNLEAPNGQTVNLVANEGGVSTYGYTDTRATSNTSIQPFPPSDYSETLTGTFRADAASQTALDNYVFKTLVGSTTPVVTTTTFSDLFTTPNGDWKIHVHDVSAGDIGVLVSWSIKISFTPPVVTPVSLLTFSGYREGSHNFLKWSTASEQTNKGFQVERSTDGVNYSSIGFVNSKALNGNSSSLLQYGFNDNNLSGSKQYYRLRQIDIDSREKLSNIILIKGQRPTRLNLSGLFPNPANNIVNIILDAPVADDVKLMVTDLSGKLIKQQSASVEAGTNTIPIDISRFTSGTYSIKLTCKSNSETVTGKFIKQ